MVFLKELFKKVDFEKIQQMKKKHDTLCLLGDFCMRFCRLLIFFTIIFKKNSFRNVIRELNSFDPDQARHFVGPNPGPKCLQKLSKNDTSG